LEWNQDGAIMIGIYDDNSMVIGKLDGIDELIVELKKSVTNLKI
jgi:hypothetical protein